MSSPASLQHGAAQTGLRVLARAQQGWSSRDLSSELCHVLSEDIELADAVPEQQRQEAIGGCVAHTLELHPGRWQAPALQALENGLGLLALDGLLIRRVGIDGRFGAELLGAGDLLRPWQEHAEPTLATSTAWSVLQTTRLAVLDERFAQRVARYPRVASALVGRALQRSRQLAINMAIVHHPRVDVRIEMILWHLAGRWGRVTTAGTVLPMRLTHTVIAELVAARRPTVTSAITELSKVGRIQPRTDGWVLLGEPPGELLELDPQTPRPDPSR